MHIYTYLTLGGSFTVGEDVQLNKSFPYQVVELLRKKGYSFNAPEIIAKTGWTTDELKNAVNSSVLLSKYDFVSLLIGANDQFSERSAVEYKQQLEELVNKTIELASGKKDHVIIMSIPDYSPSSSKWMDTGIILKEIEVFNGINKALSIQYKVQYVDVTASSKETRSDDLLITKSGLHSSEKEYSKWAEKIVEVITPQLK